MAGKKEKRGSRKANYYAAQALRTSRNKTRRAARVTRRLANWLKRGTKKNGKPVKTVERRAELRALRKQSHREGPRRPHAHRPERHASNAKHSSPPRPAGPDPDLMESEAS